MLSEQDVKLLKMGVPVTSSPSQRSAWTGEYVQFIPIKSPVTGRINRIVVQSKKPLGKGRGLK